MVFIDYPKVDLTIKGMDDVKIPRMMKIRQNYDSSTIDDIPGHIRKQMQGRLADPQQYQGKRISITAGSRGIPHLDLIIKTVVDQLKEWGADPFIVPAMGSHGGATAEGQLKLLSEYNITPESMGVPILSSMEVVLIDELDDGTPVYCDKYAYESDGIVILNKVKPHTDFRGEHESGLAKMMAIGLGKHEGASMFHRKGFSTFAERIPKVCESFIAHAPLAFGVGIVQNAYDDISHIEVVEKEHFLEKDAELLKIAKASIPNFKLDHFDLLIIDQIGKNISGNGQDPNVTGRSTSPGFEDVLDLKKMFIRGLTPETEHNACGIGLADVITRRCARDVDVQTTWITTITATMLHGCAMPMYTENDRDAIMLCIRTCNNIDFSNARVVRIKDTLHMSEIEVSEAFLEECKAHPDVEILSEPYEMQFDEEGFLLD